MQIYKPHVFMQPAIQSRTWKPDTHCLLQTVCCSLLMENDSPTQSLATLSMLLFICYPKAWQIKRYDKRSSSKEAVAPGWAKKQNSISNQIILPLIFDEGKKGKMAKKVNLSHCCWWDCMRSQTRERRIVGGRNTLEKNDNYAWRLGQLISERRYN